MIKRLESVYPRSDLADKFLIYYQPKLRFEGVSDPQPLRSIVKDSI